MDYLDIAHCFGVIRRRSQAFVVEACEKLHLTYSEYALLLKLYDAEGCSQDDMAGMLYLDKAVVTRVIKTLEGKGFIYREQDDKDRRMKRLYVTEFGKTQEEFIKNIIKRLVDYMASQMPVYELQSLMTGFQDLADKMSRADLHRI